MVKTSDSHRFMIAMALVNAEFPWSPALALMMKKYKKNKQVLMRGSAPTNQKIDTELFVFSQSLSRGEWKFDEVVSTNQFLSLFQPKEEISVEIPV
jgi:hypothetical protein